MSADTAIIEFIKTPAIQEYQWHGASLLIDWLDVYPDRTFLIVGNADTSIG